MNLTKFDTLYEASDTQLDNHIPTVGVAWSFQDAPAKLKISAGDFWIENTDTVATDTPSFAYLDVAHHADQIITITGRTIGTEAEDRFGALARAYNTGTTSSPSGYYAYIKGTGDLVLVSLATGTETSLGSYTIPAFSATTTYKIKLDCDGTTIAVDLDGTERISVTNSVYANPGSMGVACETGTVNVPKGRIYYVECEEDTAFGDLTYLRARLQELLRNDQIDDKITAWLNLSQRDLCHYINFPSLKVTLATISTLTTSASYTFTPTSNTTLDRINSIAYQDSANYYRSQLKLIEFDPDFLTHYRPHLVNTANLGIPRVASFDESGPTIWLDVYPWAASKDIIVTYQKVPVDLTNGSDVPAIPPRYYQSLIHMAYAYGKAYETDDTDWVSVGQRFAMTEIAKVKSHLRQNLSKRKSLKAPMFAWNDESL